MTDYVLAIDQGTTSTRTIIFDRQMQVISYQQLEFSQYFPQPGWVEHDAEEIWQTVLTCCQQTLVKANLAWADIAAIGIANQRETTLVWEKSSGRPIYNAIVWQDRRTAALCQTLESQGHQSLIYQKTGLLLDSYFSATKLAWIIDQVPNARSKAEQGELVFGTMDSFLLWRLTAGKVHATDATNASRTLLFNIDTQKWDDDLIRLFNIPPAMLPSVRDSNANFGETDRAIIGATIPILAIAGDQQAALIGQGCFQPGMIKSTYGTGAFLMLNTGKAAVVSENRLLTTVAYRIDGQVSYALEGSIFSAGTIIKWLRDKLGVIKQADETAALAASVADNGGVYFVPAFTGLGAPYWNPAARCAIQGLTRDSSAAHIVRAGLEAVAYQTRDLIDVMVTDSPHPITEIRVDGGMVANDWLMQYLADISNIPIARSNIAEITALGVAYLAGLQLGWYRSLAEIAELWQGNGVFRPAMLAETREQLMQQWQLAVKRVL